MIDRHCDEYIRDKSYPMCLRKFILFHRVPTHVKYRWLKRGWKTPCLFAKYINKMVRVTMASRLGDVGITYDLTGNSGYSKRVYINELSDFMEKL